MRRTIWRTRLAGASMAALAFSAGAGAHAADHADSPSVRAADPALDIADLYMFENGTNLVLVMTVNPLSGPVATEDLRFSTTGEYFFHVDTDGDVATDEHTILVQFADDGDDQHVRVRGLGSEDITGQVNTAADASSPRTVQNADGTIRVFAGPRDDPFFFSLNGGGGTGHLGFTQCDVGAGEECFLGQCTDSQGCFIDATFYPDGVVDTFAGLNVSAIVIEFPLSMLSGDNVAVWASTAE